MKKLSIITIVIIVIFSLSLALIGCTGERATIDDMIDLSKIDYASGKVIENLNSVDVFNQAIDYMSNCNNFTYTVLFNFETEPAALATQSSKEVIRKNDDRLLHEQITIGTGQGKSHQAELRLHENTKHRVVGNDISNKKDAESRVPGFNQKDKSKIFNYNLDGIAPVVLEGTVPDYEHCRQYDNYADYMYNKAASYIWYYNYNQQDLAAEHSTKVYELDGFYYCDITVDTKNCIKKGNQPDVIKDIEQGVGMKLAGFVENTILRLKIEKVDETFRFVATQLSENYKASMAKAKQTYQRKFSYEKVDYTITNSHVKLFN